MNTRLAQIAPLTPEEYDLLRFTVRQAIESARRCSTAAPSPALVSVQDKINLAEMVRP